MATAIIKQKDLLTKRWRNVEELDPSEFALQVRLVDFLRWRVRANVLWFHVPNGEWRDFKTAAKIKAMGGRAGVADLVFVWDMGCGFPQVLFLELKRSGRRPTEMQQAFRDEAQRAAAHYRWADNFTAAVDIVADYGLLQKVP
jgi:hypothetical protein